jgi:hypothetical protein
MSFVISSFFAAFPARCLRCINTRTAEIYEAMTYVILLIVSSRHRLGIRQLDCDVSLHCGFRVWSEASNMGNFLGIEARTSSASGFRRFVSLSSS